jgi:hypothetical protein
MGGAEATWLGNAQTGQMEELPDCPHTRHFNRICFEHVGQKLGPLVQEFVSFGKPDRDQDRIES